MKYMTNIYLDPKTTDDERRHYTFDGSICIFSPSPVSIALCNYAKVMIKNAFGKIDPQTAQFSMGVNDFVATIGPLKSKFTNDVRTKSLVKELLADFDCDLDKTYFDVPRLRVVTHDNYLSAGVGYAYKAHRDIWYSSPTSQLNWWMPVYKLDMDRSLALYPDYWERPIKNSSNEFNYYEWCNVGRKQAMIQVDIDTRKHPLPKEEIDTRGEIRLVSDAGTITLFSAAHLHATVPNTSGLTRFSIDFRTVHIDDLLSRRGAHNIDCSATGTTLGDFIRASDFSPIPKELIN